MFDLSKIPQRETTNWWKTIPGQLASVVIFFGALVILLGLLGIVGPRA